MMLFEREMHKNDIVCASNKEEQKIYISTNDNLHEKQKDLMCVEINNALSQSIQDNLSNGADYANNQLEKAFRENIAIKSASLIIQGRNGKFNKPFAIVDEENNKKSIIEYDGETLHCEQYSTKEQAWIPVTRSKEELAEMTPDALGAFLATQGKKMNNMVIIPLEKAEDFYALDGAEAKTYLKNVCEPDIQSMTERALTNTLTRYNQQLKEKEKAGQSPVNEFYSHKDENNKDVFGKYQHFKSTFIQEDNKIKMLNEFVEKKVQPLLSDIKNEAVQRVNAQKLSNKEVHVRQIINDIINEDLSTDRHYLQPLFDEINANNLMTESELESILKGMGTHLVNTNEKNEYEMVVKEEDISDIIKKEKAKEEEKMKRYELEKQNDYPNQKKNFDDIDREYT